MKNWKADFRRRAALPLACYLLAVLAWLALGAKNAVSDGIARANGTLTEQVWHDTDDVQLVDLELTSRDEAGDTLITTGGDPQMIWENVSDHVVRTVDIAVEYDGEPREMCLYYTTREAEPYSQDRRVFPSVQPDGTYRYTLPHTRIAALRLDPCSPDEGKTVTMQVKSITFNAPTGMAGYFVPGWYQVFCLVLYPGLAAAFFGWGMAVMQEVKPEWTAKVKKLCAVRWRR